MAIDFQRADASFTEEQIGALEKPLDAKLIKERPGGGGKLRYISGKSAIDTAHEIFGYGNWAFRTLSIKQSVIIDPLTGEAVGIEYEAIGQLTVRGAVDPMVDVGSEDVAAWNVEDLIMQRRVKDALDNHTDVNESPFTPLEKKNARAVIVDAHKQAKKAAATDALKRCLRLYGSRFGLALYDEDSLVEMDGMQVKVSEVVINKRGENTLKPSATARVTQESRQIPVPAQRQISPADQEKIKQLRALISDCLTRAKSSGVVKTRDDWNQLKIEAGVGKPDSELVAADVDRISTLLAEREPRPVEANI